MIRRWLRLLQSASCFGALVIGIGTFHPDTLHAQAGSGSAGPIGDTRVAAHAPKDFVVAPSLQLGYSPTGISAGHLTSSGNLDIVTADHNAGVLRVYRGLGPGVFAAPITYSTGAHPSDLAIADIDGDGKADVVVAEESDATVSVFPGNGDGTLGPRHTYLAGFRPSMIVIGDFSGHGRLDIAVASRSGSNLAIFQNEGSGKFDRPVNLALSTTPAAITSADFDRDGHADLAFANGNGTVSVWLGKGNLQFTRLPDVAAGRGALSAIVAGDFNRDGQEDLAVTSAAENRVAVMMGLGDGRFSSPDFYGVGNAPVSAHVSDLDGDGIPDLVVINSGDNTFSVLNGRGDGTFRPAVNFVIGNTPLGAAAGDFYGNGHIDLVTIDQLSQTLSVPAGNGDGTFIAGRAYAAGSQPVSVASGDLNSDGKPDLVVASYCRTEASCAGNGSAAVLTAGPADTYQLMATYPMGTGSISIALIDVNRDKKLDLVALNRVDKTLSLRLGAGDGTFGQLITIPLSGAPVAMASGDFNKDGNLDLAVLEDCGSATCSLPGEVEVLLGAGDGNFRSLSSYPTGYSPVALAVGATYLNGNADLLVANRCGRDASCQSGGTATILFGDGAGAFKPGADIALGNSPSSIALANLRSSGVLDLVVSRTADNTVAILPGTGKGSFQPAVSYAVGKTPGALAIADFNGDGKPDVAVANSGDATVSVLFGQGDGTLQPAFSLPVSGNPMAVTAIGPPKMTFASLATASGSVVSPSASPNVTVITNLKATPLLTGGIVPTISITWTAGSSSPSSVNETVSFTATVTGTTGNGAPTGGSVEFFSDGTAISDCGGTNGITVTPGGGLVSKAACPTSVLTASSSGHAITAQYLGANDTVYDNSAVSSAITQVVSPLAGTLAISSSAGANTTVGTSVTFTAKLSAGSLAPVTPSGTVTFTINGSTTTDCPAATIGSNNQAQCTTTSLVAPSDAIIATYSGDANYTVANPAVFTETVTKATPTVSISALSGSIAVNQSVTFSATVANSASGTQTVFPSGNVVFSQGGSTLCTAGLNSTVNPATASCAYSFKQTVTGTLVATYSGDDNFTAGTPQSTPLTVSSDTTILSVTSSGSAGVGVGQPVTLNTVITPQYPGTAVPQGTVSFTTSGPVLPPTGTCTSAQTVSSTGTVPSCTLTFAGGGAYTVTAKFTPSDSNFQTSSTSITQNVNFGSLAITLISPGASEVNQSVTFTASFTPTIPSPVPTGNITYYDGATTLCVVAIGSNAAIPGCPFTFTTAGTHVIQAKFAGDQAYTAVGSNVVSQVVNRTPVATAVSSNPTSAPVNTPVSFTTTLTPTFSGTVVPTGSVTFTQTNSSNQTTTLCVELITSGTAAACPATFTSTGAYSITATYNGDTNFVQGTSTSENFVVGATNITGTITPPSGTVYVNEPVLFSADVKPTQTGASVPTGTFTFTDTTSNLAAPTAPCTTAKIIPDGSGGASGGCNLTFLAGGSHQISVTYSGDPNFTGGLIGSPSLTVSPTATTTTLATPSPVLINQQATFTATITPAFSGTTIPQGSVVFTNTSASPAVTLCTQTVSASGTVPACSYAFNTAGTYKITATFNPSNGNFQSSTSVAVNQTVSAASAPINLTASVPSGPNPPVVNESVTFTAAFTPPVTGTQPNGKVSYVDSINPGTPVSICGGSVVNGAIPQCIVPFGAVGNHPVTTQFTPTDTNFGPTTSNSVTQGVVQATTTVGVSSSVTSPSVNQAVTFTATVTPAQYVNAALAVPSGLVTFSSNGAAICTSVPTVFGTGAAAGSGVATCSYAFAASGSYTVSAAYNGDSNFHGNSGSTAQAVGANLSSTIAVTPSLTTSVVNQPVSFSVVISPTIPGATTPTGSVTFSDNGNQIVSSPPSCALVGRSDHTSAATCTLTFLTEGAHVIVATYGGDGNFSRATGPNPGAPVTVNPASTALTLVSSSPVSFIGQTVIYTAKISPGTYLGPSLAIPLGTVTFASTDKTDLVQAACPNPVSLASNGDGTASASCSVTFQHSSSPVGQLTVIGTYSDTVDKNFQASDNTASPTPQTVQDFNITKTVTPLISQSISSAAGIYLTQGQSTGSDPFGPATMAVNIATSAGYNPKLTVACEVYSTSAQAPVSDPSCSPLTAPPVQITQNAGAQAFGVAASSTAPVAGYTVRFTVSDPLDPNSKINAQFVEFPLFVVGLSPQLSLATGGIGTGSVAFDTALAPSSITISSYNCPHIWVESNNTLLDNTTNSLATCSGPTGQAISTTGASTSISVQINTNGTTTAENQHGAGAVALANLLGAPIFALITWYATRGSRRKNLFRFLGMIVLLFTLVNLNGCGSGSFHLSSPPPSSGLQAGTYRVEVVATDSSGTKYYSQLPLAVVQGGTAQ